MRALVVAMLICQAGGEKTRDGGVFSQPPYDSCPETMEQAVEIDGGAWLTPKPRAARQACLIATCEMMGEPPAATPGGYLVVGAAAFGLGVIAGAVALAFVRR